MKNSKSVVETASVEIPAPRPRLRDWDIGRGWINVAPGFKLATLSTPRVKCTFAPHPLRNRNGFDLSGYAYNRLAATFQMSHFTRQAMSSSDTEAAPSICGTTAQPLIRIGMVTINAVATTRSI